MKSYFAARRREFVEALKMEKSGSGHKPMSRRKIFVLKTWGFLKYHVVDLEKHSSTLTLPASVSTNLANNVLIAFNYVIDYRTTPHMIMMMSQMKKRKNEVSTPPRRLQITF
jgi:hypothetical protein